MAGLLGRDPLGPGLLGGYSAGMMSSPQTMAMIQRAMTAPPPKWYGEEPGIVANTLSGIGGMFSQAHQAMPWGGNDPSAIGINPQSGTIDPSVMVPWASGMAGMATAGSLAAPAVPGAAGMGIRAYHASPHDFDRFDLSKVGTGQGAQSYGYGHYLAESEKVSGRGGTYDQEFSANPRYVEVGGDRIPVAANLRQTMTPKDRAAYFAAKGDIDDAIRLHKQKARDIEVGEKPTSFQIEGGWGDLDLLRGTVTELEALKAAGARPGKAKIYEVDIDASPDEFLDWDKPLSEQPPKVRDAMKAAGFTEPDPRMADKYKTVGVMIQAAKGPETSAELRAAGIKGIRYKDAGSRTAEGGTSNYVVFDDNTINILKKYGIAGLAGGGAAAAALQPSDEGNF